jgi:hypothetical protein
MAGFIEISQIQTWDGHTEVELRDILNELEPEGRSLVWVIRGLWAIGDISVLGRTMRDLMEESERSDIGVSLSWQEFVDFAAHARQVIDGNFEAYRNESEIPSTMAPFDERRAAMYAPAQIVIESLDGSVWSIIAQDDVVLERLKRRFDGVDVAH